jgi:UDP-N-acetylmuramoylalanine-D-glutamate ligase
LCKVRRIHPQVVHVVLQAPAAASFDQHAVFEKRMGEFTALVKGESGDMKSI